jgi:regulator of cell morphogenesis and NO signaling
VTLVIVFNFSLTQNANHWGNKRGDAMTTKTTKTVREVALENPAATAVLESLGIDYCCGGHLPFDEACSKVGKNADDVARQISDAAQAAAARAEKSTDWNSRSLTELLDHINSTHHVFVRAEIPRLTQLADKVASKHGEHSPELLQVKSVLGALFEELTVHLMKEEQILFPYIERLEESKLEHGAAPPSTCFGTVENPIRMMMFEHDNAGVALRELRKLTNDYQVPPDGCTSFRAFYQGLLAFEADLHQHIHLENNILFPRAIALASGN